MSIESILTLSELLPLSVIHPHSVEMGISRTVHLIHANL